LTKCPITNPSCNNHPKTAQNCQKNRKKYKDCAKNDKKRTLFTNFYKKIRKNYKKYTFFCRIPVPNLPKCDKSENPKFTRHSFRGGQTQFLPAIALAKAGKPNSDLSAAPQSQNKPNPARRSLGEDGSNPKKTKARSFHIRPD